MKYAQRIEACFEIACPHCEAMIPAPDGTGSHLWNAQESRPPEIVTCPGCGKESRVPKTSRPPA
jgi:RNase P subunit RPR2